MDAEAASVVVVVEKRKARVVNWKTRREPGRRSDHYAHDLGGYISKRESAHMRTVRGEGILKY